MTGGTHVPGPRLGAVVAWAFLGLSSLWLLLLWLAPLSVLRVGTRSWSLAVATYAVGGRVCHQRPERSFHIGAIQLPVCARCTGLYVGAPIGAALAIARRRSSDCRVGRWPPGGERTLLAALALPTLLTLAFESAGVPVSGLVRAVAGAPFSLAASRLVLGALVGGAPHR